MTTECITHTKPQRTGLQGLCSKYELKTDTVELVNEDIASLSLLCDSAQISAYI